MTFFSMKVPFCNLVCQLKNYEKCPKGYSVVAWVTNSVKNPGLSSLTKQKNKNKNRATESGENDLG